MKKSLKVLFYAKKPKNYTEGAVPIYLRLTVDGLRTEWPTQRECVPEQWNARASRVAGNTKEAKAINGWLQQLNANVYEIQRMLFAEGKDITAVSIRNKMLGKEEETQVHTLVEVFEYHNQQFSELVGKEYSFGTLKKYKSVLTSLKKFIKSKYKVADIPITNLNY